MTVEEIKKNTEINAFLNKGNEILVLQTMDRDIAPWFLNVQALFCRNSEKQKKESGLQK